MAPPTEKTRHTTQRHSITPDRQQTTCCWKQNSRTRLSWAGQEPAPVKKVFDGGSASIGARYPATRFSIAWARNFLCARSQNGIIGPSQWCRTLEGFEPVAEIAGVDGVCETGFELIVVSTMKPADRDLFTGFMHRVSR